MRPTDFWPIVAVCDRCGQEIAENDAVAIVIGAVWAGWSHDECPEDSE